MTDKPIPPTNTDLAISTLRAMNNLSWKAKVAMLTKLIDDIGG